MAWYITYSMGDGKFKFSDIEVKLPDSATFPQIDEFAQTFAPTIQALAGGLIGSIHITAIRSGYTGKPNADFDSDIEEKGVFMFETLGAEMRMSIPTFKEAFIIDGTDLIDQSATEVATFLSIMISGLTLLDSTVLQPVNGRGDDVISLKSAHEKFRNRKR